MLQECSMFNVAGIFFDQPTKPHYLMEISQKSKLAHTSVKKYLQQLLKMNQITESSEKKGRRIFPIYKSNLNHPYYKKMKRIHNLFRLEESGLIDFLHDQLMPNCIILFGSYLRGEDTEESDIDLFIESKEEKLDLKKFEKKLNRKIQLHFKEKFSDYPSELKNNIINGIALRGYLEVFK